MTASDRHGKERGMLTKRSVGAAAALIAIALIVAACGGGAESSTPKTSATPVASATVMVAANPGLGKILVDARGMTLYVFGADTPGTSNCSGACLQNWPTLTVAGGTPVAGPGVTGTLDVITRSDGTKQVTLDGMPLYTFAFDKQAGDTNGQGLNEFGGIWTAVGASGAPASGTGTTPSSTAVSPSGYQVSMTS
jgi:predicted lipoprotein with Yx(FWY)xxD motif